MHGQQRVKQMGEADALGLGNEAEEGAVAVEAPRARLLGNPDTGFVLAIEQLVGHLARLRLVGQLDSGVPVPLHADNRDEAVGQDAFDSGVGCEIFQFHNCRPFCRD